MRAYFFSSMYISSIQNGIQALHVVGEMFVKYRYLPERGAQVGDMLFDWATNHKTVVLLNGGDQDSLVVTRELMVSDSNPYPHASFFEDGLGGALTSVGIVIPERLYDPFSTKIGKTYNDQAKLSTSPETTFPNRLNEADFAEGMKRQYTEWELRFLSQRVLCDLAR